MRRLLILTSLILASACSSDLAKVGPSDWPPLPQNPTVSVQTLTPSPSHSPETLITTINVVDKLNIPKWHLAKVLTDWNKAKFVRFRLVKYCLTYEDTPCVTVDVRDLPGTKSNEITVGQAEWGNAPWEMTITLNPQQLSANYAQSTLCHEFGHIIGLPHINIKPHSSKRLRTCMEANDDNAPISPTYLDIKLANMQGPWSWEKSMYSSGRDVDAEDIH